MVGNYWFFFFTLFFCEKIGEVGGEFFKKKKGAREREGREADLMGRGWLIEQKEGEKRRKEERKKKVGYGCGVWLVVKGGKYWKQRQTKEMHGWCEMKRNEVGFEDGFGRGWWWLSC